jgi:hypothetical protein
MTNNLTVQTYFTGMKKLVLSIVLSAACTLPLSAARAPQNDEKSVNVAGTQVTRDAAGMVNVSFQLKVGEKVTASNRSLVIYPVLEGGGSQIKLSPVIIRGGRVGAAVERPAMSAAGLDGGGNYVTSNGKILEYHASATWQGWMSGSKLMLNGLNVGKKGATEVNIGVVAENLLMDRTSPASAHGSANDIAQQAPPRAPQPPVQVAPIASHERGVVVQRSMYSHSGSGSRDVGGYYLGTIGDKLSARFTFVEPVSKFDEARNASSTNAVFDYNMPLVFGTATPREDSDMSRFVEMTRQGAIHVRFERGSNIMDRDLADNNTTYVDLISAIRMLDANYETRVAQVVVVGFSSPEGINDEKESFAMERALAVRDFLTANSHIDPNVISTYNGSVDWTTLRALVSESNMPEKYSVLDIIDNAPAWNAMKGKGRFDRLMAIGNGEAFRYMREHFFPKLRQTGAYVKVYYENMQ